MPSDGKKDDGIRTNPLARLCASRTCTDSDSDPASTNTDVPAVRRPKIPAVAVPLTLTQDFPYIACNMPIHMFESHHASKTGSWGFYTSRHCGITYKVSPDVGVLLAPPNER